LTRSGKHEEKSVNSSLKTNADDTSDTADTATPKPNAL
jgi:hypothetical protein